MIEIHHTAFVSPLSDIEDSVKGSRVVIGPGSYIDAFVKIKAAGGTGDIVMESISAITSRLPPTAFLHRQIMSLQIGVGCIRSKGSDHRAAVSELKTMYG
jgi:hypothetical protein